MGVQNPVFAVDYIETTLMSRFLQRKDKNLLCPLQVIDRACETIIYNRYLPAEAEKKRKIDNLHVLTNTTDTSE